MHRRIIFTLGREQSDHTVRLRIQPRHLAALVVLGVGLPIIVIGGAAWGARAVVADLLRQNASLQMENASYREATSELVAQVSTLQAAADHLGARATVDPQAAQAMARLPASISRRAMGGSSVADAAAPLAGVAATAEPAFSLLRDVLHVVERQLDRARAGVERREALAAATPSIWPATGWLSSTFGRRTDPFTGGPGYHEGIDISADPGEPVRATADGSVVTARYNGNLGNMILLDHGFGISTRYGHLSKLAVREGQAVRKGDTIGHVGSTGRSTSPHLHYELLLNGRPANPLRLLGR